MEAFNIFLAALSLLLAISSASPTQQRNTTKLAKELNAEGQFKIVGGSLARIEDFPYQLALLMDKNFICGASIISPNYALTAAHCVKDLKASSLALKAGSSSLTSGGEFYRVKEVSIHPNYAPITSDFDVAILKVIRPFKFGSQVGQIKIAQPGHTFKFGAQGVVAGWGRTQSWESISYFLRSALVPLVERKTCQYSHGGLITDRMMCAGSGERDSCQGDSGGPLVVDGVQVGVVSWGLKQCATAGYPGVYTKLSEPNINTWIKRVTQLSDDSNQESTTDKDKNVFTNGVVKIRCTQIESAQFGINSYFCHQLAARPF